MAETRANTINTFGGRGSRQVGARVKMGSVERARETFENNPPNHSRLSFACDRRAPFFPTWQDLSFSSPFFFFLFSALEGGSVISRTLFFFFFSHPGARLHKMRCGVSGDPFLLQVGAGWYEMDG